MIRPLAENVLMGMGRSVGKLGGTPRSAQSFPTAMDTVILGGGSGNLARLYYPTSMSKMVGSVELLAMDGTFPQLDSVL